MMTREKFVEALLRKWGSGLRLTSPAEGDQVLVTLDDVLTVLATGGVRDASDILRAHRKASAYRTSVRAAHGRVITFAEARESAPTPEARKAVLSRGRCEAKFRDDEDGPVGYTCELVRGHVQLNKGEPHAALRNAGADPELEESWVRW